MKGKYITAREIDGRAGIKTPHEHELEELGKVKLKIFLENKYRRIKILVENNLQGIVENIDFNENYTLTFEFFPEVKAHVLFFNYEDEEDEALGGSELKFLFSGARVQWIPSEDLISLLDAHFEYLEILLSDQQENYPIPSEKTELLKTSLQQRTEPFASLEMDHLGDLATFVGGRMKQNTSSWQLTKTFLPGIDVVVSYDLTTNRLDVTYEGESKIKINNYLRDQLGIFLLNHCLRFLAISYSKVKKLKIVSQTFSYSYLKEQYGSS
jgi:hypothetical protein